MIWPAEDSSEELLVRVEEELFELWARCKDERVELLDVASCLPLPLNVSNTVCCFLFFLSKISYHAVSIVSLPVFSLCLFVAVLCSSFKSVSSSRRRCLCCTKVPSCLPSSGGVAAWWKQAEYSVAHDSCTRTRTIARFLGNLVEASLIKSCFSFCFFFDMLNLKSDRPSTATSPDLKH